jgi:hypothetical protein
MRKVKWHGDSKQLTSAWSAPYRTGGGGGDIRLGDGSGSTPTMMVTAKDPARNRFVVITDGEDVMNLDLFYRDGIPTSARTAGSDNPRLACEHRIDFGAESTEAANSEQSVLVRGPAVVVVNNVLNGPPIGASVPRRSRCWHRTPTGSRTCPSSRPSRPARPRLFYGIGLEGDSFGVTALDWDTCRNRGFAKAPSETCPPAVLDPTVEPFLEPALRGGTQLLRERVLRRDGGRPEQDDLRGHVRRGDDLPPSSRPLYPPRA